MELLAGMDRLEAQRYTKFNEVKFECGSKFEVLNVAEPNPCEYSFLVSSPLTCSEEPDTDKAKVVEPEVVLKNPQRQS